MIACAPLVASETITLNDYRTNYLSVSQQSPFEDTIFTINTSPPGSFSILNSANFCPHYSSSIYTPYPVNRSVTTPDRHPLGDWDHR